MKRLILTRKRDHSLLRRHPWIFSGSVERSQGDPQDGETVDLVSAEGAWLACAAYAHAPQIRARVWAFEKTEIDEEFFRLRVRQAVQLREFQYGGSLPSACRLIFGESDGLPGLTVDKYGDFLSCQFHAAGVDRHRAFIVGALRELVPCAGLYERSDAELREREGLQPSEGLLGGEEPPPLLEISEGACRFLVNLRSGHKTGFYLDQRINRALTADYCTAKQVLNAFSYTGAFGVWALRAGAKRVVNVESSGDALTLVRRNAELNGCDPKSMENIEGDVFKVLREFRDRARQFDVIILDPPKFADSESQLGKASRGYKDINLLAFKLLKPGGVLVTFSCSGAMPEPLFHKIVADAALDSGRDAWIERRLGQSPDHPVLLSFPEAAYLKGFLCRVR